MSDDARALDEMIGKSQTVAQLMKMGLERHLAEALVRAAAILSICGNVELDDALIANSISRVARALIVASKDKGAIVAGFVDENEAPFVGALFSAAEVAQRRHIEELEKEFGVMVEGGDA